jgi:outer membrane protein assembly factor BamE (lipoprotein component of BamABCDE complex)
VLDARSFSLATGDKQMRLRQLLLLSASAGLCIALSGCFTVGNKKLDDVNSYLVLKEQQSTKSDVYNVFGQPHDVRSLDSGDSVWVYYKMHTRPSAWTFVPIVGYAAGGSARQMTFAYFVFNQPGTLQKIETKSGSDYENMWAGLGRGVSRFSDKTQAQRVHDEMDRLGKPFDEKVAKSVASLRDK